jgi:hypothetical protein
MNSMNNYINCEVTKGNDRSKIGTQRFYSNK